MAKMFQLNVHIPKEMNANLEKLAEEQGVTKAHIVRKCLKTCISRMESDDVETAYDSMSIDLNKRLETVEKRLDEKESKGWIRKKLNL